MATVPYTLEQAEEDIATLRGQVDLQTEIVSTVAFTTTVTSGGAAETWHTVGAGGQPAFGANFSSAGAGTAAPVGFQLEGMNGLRVRLRGQVNLGANQVQFATIFTLPTGYQPTYIQYFITPNNLNGAALGNTIIKVTAAGAVQLGVGANNTNFVVLDGIVIELD
jgi:hypothetical protein